MEASEKLHSTRRKCNWETYQLIENGNYFFIFCKSFYYHSSHSLVFFVSSRSGTVLKCKKGKRRRGDAFNSIRFVLHDEDLLRWKEIAKIVILKKEKIPKKYYLNFILIKSLPCLLIKYYSMNKFESARPFPKGKKRF